MKKIKLLLAEDQTIVREGIHSLLEKSVDFEVVGEAEDGREAIKKVEELAPDIVLMDIRMPGLNGIEATGQIKKHFPNVKVIILSMHTDEEYIFEALRAGASGYILKHAAHEELFSAIRAAYENNIFLSPSVSKKVVEAYSQFNKGIIPEPSVLDKLTQREREVLQLIAEGKSSKEISNLLFISTATVETHKSHLKEKLGLRKTADLIRFAYRKGIPGTE
jgi:DNA-binding NarL/FixJ family response regulator